MKPFHLLWIAAATLVGCGQDAPPATAVAPTETSPVAVDIPPTLDEPTYRARIATLSSDEFEGRGPASAGERKTVPYLIEQYKALGLQPGNGDSYTQAVPMREIVTEQAQPLVVSVGGKSMTFKPMDEVVLSTRMADPTVAVKDAELVYVGYGVTAPENNWDDYAGIDVKDKIVVTLINDPGFHDQNPDLFRGKAMTYYGRWSYKFEEAARHGAAGVIIIHDEAGASYPWDVVRNGASRPTFDLPLVEGEPLLKAQGWMQSAQARELFSAAGLDFDAAFKAAGQPGFKAVDLKATGSFTLKSEARTAQSDNVIAVIPGTEKPDEVIIYAAHWDHLGRNFQMPDGVFNGAIDNATGTAGLISIAEQFMRGPKPKRSVVFLTVTLEESGLLGSRYYAQNPVYPLAKTVAAINIDAMHPVGQTEDMIVIGYGASELEPILEAQLAKSGRRAQADLSPEAGYFYRSDHFNFARQGVPALYAKSGMVHRTKGIEYGRALLADYTANRYHKPSDDLLPDTDLTGIVEDLGVLYAVGAELANGDQWPAWYAGNEFKATREASRAGSTP